MRYVMYNNSQLHPCEEIIDLINDRKKLYESNRIDWITQCDDEYKLSSLIHVGAISILCVYNDTDTLVGISEAIHVDGIMIIKRLIVDDKYRRQGIASEMIKLWKKDFENRANIKFLRVEVKNENAVAKKLYKKLGFTDRKAKALQYQVDRG